MNRPQLLRFTRTHASSSGLKPALFRPKDAPLGVLESL